MSTFKAVSAVTRVLVQLINVNSEIDQLAVSEHPEKFFNNDDDRINVHLYHIKENQHLRNINAPYRDSNYVKTSPAFISLDLYYCIMTNSQSTLLNEWMLGHVMVRFFENAVISKNFIQSIENNAYGLDFTNVKLSTENIELLKISMENLSLDEASKVWAMYGSKYRPCAYYKVSVVLMKSDKEIYPGPPVKDYTVTVLPHNPILIESVGNDEN
ncbi:MAG: DUF4255 domain-containing protein [Saprospiraceae bacterium]|nr:DUF4255 domain-containing protein [Saprospiraceae bacterium]